jgi:serine/arginine repetitive matrix protein 2
MKTPKPPGAWSQTPGRPGRDTPSLPRVQSLSEDTVDLNGGLATPPTTLSKRNSLPLQTPAPPGAWLGTPGVGSVGRRSILKVRFDVAPSETETVTSVDNRDDEISLDSIEMIHPSDEDVTGFVQPEVSEDKSQPLSTGAPSINGHTLPTTEPATPVLKATRSPFTTPPSVRIVDAFGRERVDWSEEEVKNKGVDISPMSLPPGPASPQGNKSLNGGIRFVDAMGHQVEESGFSSHEDKREEPLTREQALSRVKETISSLAREMSDVEL